MIAPDRTSAFHQLMCDAARSMESPVVLELGTQHGTSAKALLAACKENGGTVVSVDLQDCSQISQAPNFIFVQSDSTSVRNILSKAPILSQGIHMLYVDTTRHRSHLQKEVASWWPFIRPEGWLFCRGVDPGPYRRGARKDAIVLEKEAEERARFFIEFSVANVESCDLAIHYGSTGLAVVRKWSEIGTRCNAPIPLSSRPLAARALYVTRQAAKSVRQIVTRLAL
jgi:hypothetical protein